jgi:small conductance mechanosensitive channel
MHLAPPLLSILDELGIDSSLAAWIARIAGLVFVWGMVWVLVRYLSRWIRRLDEQSEHFDISARDLKTVDRVLDYITVLAGIIVSLAILGWTSLLYSALTAAGLFSVIMGLAVKDVAANLVSGIFILIDRPFAPGDYIEVGGQSGTVQGVTLRATTLVTVDGPVVHIPNSVVAVQPTINYSVAEARAIKFTISIANDADVKLALKTIKQVIEDEQGVLDDRTQLVLVDDVREYAVDIKVLCYAPTDTWMALGSDLQQRSMTALQEKGIEMAVPMRKHINLDLLSDEAQANGTQ